MSQETEFWKNTLKEAREQYQVLCVRRDALEVQRETVETRIMQLEATIKNLSDLASETPFEKMEALVIENATEIGLADAVREILKNATRHLTAIEIRDLLEDSNFDLTPYSNALASIHGILKRFEESGEVSLAQRGRTRFYRIAPPKRVTPIIAAPIQPPARRTPNPIVKSPEDTLQVPIIRVTPIRPMPKDDSGKK